MTDSDKIGRAAVSLAGAKIRSQTDPRLRSVDKAFRLVDMAEAMAGVGHWHIELPAKAVTWSAQVFRIHGLEPGPDPIDLLQAVDVYHPDDRPIVAAHVGAALRDGTPYAFDLRLIRGDGDLRHVLSRGMAELDADGRVVAVFGT